MMSCATGLFSAIGKHIYTRASSPQHLSLVVNNEGQGLVKLVTCSGVPRSWVDVQRRGRFLQVIIVSMLLMATVL